MFSNLIDLVVDHPVTFLFACSPVVVISIAVIASYMGGAW